MRAPRERSRTLVGLVLPVSVPIAALPPDEVPFAAVPLWRWPALPCWFVPELPCCFMPELPRCFAPVLDCEPESCVCASWRRPVAGSAATGAATARTAAAPNITASIRILLLLRRVSPQDNPAVDVGFPRAAKIMDEPMFIFGARF